MFRKYIGFLSLLINDYLRQLASRLPPKAPSLRIATKLTKTNKMKIKFNKNKLIASDETASPDILCYNGGGRL